MGVSEPLRLARAIDMQCAVRVVQVSPQCVTAGRWDALEFGLC
jgi:hypothetical protein